MGVTKTLLKVSKICVGLIGTLTAGICLGIGTYATVNAEQNKTMISNFINDVNTSVNQIDEQINGNKENSIDSIFDQVKNGLTTLKDAKQTVKDYINTAILKIEEQIVELKKQRDNVVDELGKLTLPPNTNYQQTIDDTINVLNSTLAETDNILNDVKTFDKKIDAVADIDAFERIVSELNQTSDKYFKQIKDLQKILEVEKVNKYYDIISQTMYIVGASVFGLLVVGSIISFVLYKDVDGKIVSRFRAKKDLEKHLRKIIDKNPEIIHEIERR